MMRAAQRQAEALQLYASGMSWDAVASQLGYANRSGAHKAAMVALSKVPEPAAEEYRKIQAMRLDAWISSIWDASIAGNLRAIETGLKIEERRARLFGLDLQPALAAEQPGVLINALILKIVNDPELAEIADQLAARLSRTGSDPLEPPPPGGPPIAGLLASRTPS